MSEEKITPWIEAGRGYGYPECCVQNYNHLCVHGLSPAIIMDYIYGEDSCKEYIRCPECRDKHDKKPKFSIQNYAWNRDVANQILGELRVSIRVVDFLRLLPRP